MSYFDNFPKIDIKLSDGVLLNITDITLRTKIINSIDSLIYLYESYTIKDGDRPDTIAYRYYGRSDLDWIILIANNLMGLVDWPKTDSEIYDGLIKIYGSDSAIDNVNNPNAVLYYEDINRIPVSYDSGGEKFAVTILQNELRENDKKRKIRLIKREYINQVVTIHNNLISGK